MNPNGYSDDDYYSVMGPRTQEEWDAEMDTPRRIEGGTTGGVTYSASFDGEPSPEEIKALDAVADETAKVLSNVDEEGRRRGLERLRGVRERVERRATQRAEGAELPKPGDRFALWEGTSTPKPRVCRRDRGSSHC